MALTPVYSLPLSSARVGPMAHQQESYYLVQHVLKKQPAAIINCIRISEGGTCTAVVVLFVCSFKVFFIYLREKRQVKGVAEGEREKNSC